MDLKTQLRDERLAAYDRLRGGYPVPLAGAIWWLGLAAAGHAGLSLAQWCMLAFVTSGLIFPLALLLARLLRCNFMADRTAVTGVLAPAFIAMMLFWPMAVSAFWAYPALVPLILAIGMSLHWPVIGWSYGRTAIYSGHAVVRAAICFAIWNWLPAERLTLLPLSVAVVYLATVAVILLDTSWRRRRAARSPA